MSEQYLAEVRIFGFNFATTGWAKCQGQVLNISQNNALFAIIGATYGGNGSTTFALPNLQDLTAVGMGQGLGLMNWSLGQIFGETNHTLSINEAPQHGHAAMAGDGVAIPAQGTAPTATSYLGREKGGAYATTNNTTLAAPIVGMTGSSLPHPNIQPVLVMNYCIALTGAFPSRN
jgi:microcystin-dependent protein